MTICLYLVVFIQTLGNSRWFIESVRRVDCFAVLGSWRGGFLLRNEEGVRVVSSVAGRKHSFVVYSLKHAYSMVHFSVEEAV